MPVTVGVNSYLTRAEAGTYFADRLYASDWSDADGEDQDRAMLMACRELNRQHWLGAIASATQRLAWPRTGLVDAEGRVIAATVVPQAIKDAQSELALAYLREDLTRDPASSGIRRESKTVGPISKMIEYEGRAPERRLPDTVLALVQPYLAEAPCANSVRIAL